MKTIYFFILFALVSFPVCGQIENDTNEIDYRVGLSTKLFLIPQRSLFIPMSTYNSEFYQDHFGLTPPPLNINRGVATLQTTGNFALTINSLNKKIEFEFGFDFGYQYSGIENDKFYSEVTAQDTTYRNAEISIDYKLHKLSSGGYILMKSNNSLFNVYIGIGLGHYLSIGKANVTNTILGNTIENYKTKFKNYSNFTPYLALGLEIPLGKKSNDFYLKIMGSLRREVNNYNFRPNRLFITGGIQFQYQF